MQFHIRIAVLSIFLSVWFINSAISQDFNALVKLYQQVIYSAPKDLNKADSLNEEFKRMVAAQKSPHDSILYMGYFLDGVLNLYKDRYFLAEKYFKDVIATAAGSQANYLTENSYNNLGVIYHKRNQLRKSLEAYLESIRFAEMRNDSNTIVQTWINISLIENKRKDTAKAIDIGKRVLDYAYRNDDAFTRALCHQNLAIFYNEMRDFKKADLENKKALALYQSLGVVYNKCGLQMNMAGSLITRQDYGGAAEIIGSVLPEITTNGFEGLKIQANLLLGIIAMDGYRKFAEAEGYFQTAERLSKEFGKGEDLPSIYENLTKLGMHTQRKALFEDALEKFKTHHEQQFSLESVAALEEMMVLYELDKERAKQFELNSKMELRNKQFWFVVILLLVLFTAAGIMLNQYLRLKSAYSVLFRLNIEQIRPQMKLSHHENIPEEAKPNGNSDSHSIDTEKDYKAILAFLESDNRYRIQDYELHNVASSLQMSIKHFNSVIKFHAGTNFPGLLNKMRVQEARRLILTSGQTLSLKEIAFEVGFNNRISFYRQFKEETGLSPSEFRDMVINDLANSIPKE